MQVGPLQDGETIPTTRYGGKSLNKEVEDEYRKQLLDLFLLERCISYLNLPMVSISPSSRAYRPFVPQRKHTTHSVAVLDC